MKVAKTTAFFDANSGRNRCYIGVRSMDATGMRLDSYTNG